MRSEKKMKEQFVVRIFDRFCTSVFFQKEACKFTMVTGSGFHGSIIWSNMRLRMFSWPICSEPVVSLGNEQIQCSAQYNSIRVDIWAAKGVNIYSVQSGNLLSNLKQLSALVVHKNLRTDWVILLQRFFVVIRLVPIHFVAVLSMPVCFERVAAFFLEQVHSLIQLSFCCLNKYFPALGWLLLYLFTDVFIYQPLLSNLDTEWVLLQCFL